MSSAKRPYHRYNKLCIYCCKMIKSQNMARHIKTEHPNSETETNFVPCLVPAKYLRQLQNNNSPPPPPPPPPPFPSAPTTPPQLDAIDLMDFYYELIRKVRAKAKVNCTACLRSQTRRIISMSLTCWTLPNT